MASEKGASSWLTSLPLAEYGFRLEFVDAICLRYDLKLTDVPMVCVCGDTFSISHSLTCGRGGFTIWRHDTIRNTIHDLVKDVCKDTRKEPGLIPVGDRQLPAGANRADGARADVSTLGFWRPLCRAFFYVKVFNPLAKTNWTMEIPKMYTFHEGLKKVKYNARILEIDQGTFTPLIVSCTGGVSKETDKFIKKLAEKISLKKKEEYSNVVSFVRRRIRFDLLKACVTSLRGERHKRGFTGEATEGLDFGVQNFEAN